MTNAAPPIRDFPTRPLTAVRGRAAVGRVGRAPGHSTGRHDAGADRPVVGVAAAGEHRDKPDSTKGLWR
jgi:hypothetical protein